MSSPDSLFASWLAGRSSAEPVELEELVRAHPEHEAALREVHGQWRRLEELRQRFGLSGSLAERLRAVHGSELDPKVELSDEGSGDFTEEVLGKLAGRAPASTRYRREGELARGGMGVVLRVWDEDLRRRLAMKVLLDAGAPGEGGGAARDSRHLARLLEEAQVTAQLDHPGIVPVHELGVGADGEVFFTMKLVKGKTLASVFDELGAGEGGWTRTRVLGLLVKVCEAMSYAHAKGVIHRDLKPANVMVGRYGEVYVMDWGLAKILGREDDKDVRVRAEPELTSEVRSDRRDRAGEMPDSPLYTMDGDVVGTPAYMSPEQAMGRVSEMGPPSDVYALGAMLYHLLAGHMPYVPYGARLNNYAVWQRVQEGPPRPLHEVARDAPAELVAICMRAMAREAEARYTDMGALADDLSAYIEGRVVRAYETGAWAEARKWARRNKALAASLAAAALMLFLGMFVSLALRDRALRGEAEAQREKASVLRLAAFQTIDDLKIEADRMWPLDPTIERRYEIWLEHANRMLAEVPEHRAALTALEMRGQEQNGAAGAPVTDDDQDRWWLGQLRKLLEQLASFSDPASGLVTGISPDHGWGVERRLEFVRRIEERSVSGAEPARRWTEALEAIGRSEKYSGTTWPGGALRPQLGLVPIGPDPASELWEFAHLASGEPAERDAQGRLRMTEETGVVLVLIPGGSFWMGAQNSDPAGRGFDERARSDEGPVHHVTLGPYFLSKYEMTQGQWKRLSGHNPATYGDFAEMPGDLRPVEQVSWEDCAALLPRYGLRLPTEAQWEYGCRAGTDTVWWTGSDLASLQGVANIADATARDHSPGQRAVTDSSLNDGFGAHGPVGSLAPNPFGLHDVHGNVWEWCRDAYGRYAGSEIRAGDGEHLLPGSEERVYRGGTWDLPAYAGHSSGRFGNSASHRSSTVGVRPAAAVAVPRR